MLSAEIVLERLAQSIHAAIISDTIFGNKRKINIMIQLILLIIILFQFQIEPWVSGLV